MKVRFGSLFAWSVVSTIKEFSMKRLAAIALILLGVGLCASTPASARPYGWYGYGGYRPYYRSYYAPRPYVGAYRYPGYRAFYPGVGVGVGLGYPGYGYGYYGGTPAYSYGYPGYYGYPGGGYGYNGW
jgi:hypothetical protein